MSTCCATTCYSSVFGLLGMVPLMALDVGDAAEFYSKEPVLVASHEFLVKIGNESSARVFSMRHACL